MKQRIRYYDLAKGLLMILVVLHHIHMHGAKILGDQSVSVFLDYADDYWVMWFMPAFFMISGICSNYDKPFKEFIYGKFKGLVIPSVCLGFFFIIVGQLIIGPLYFLHECKRLLLEYIPNGGSLWFLQSLFVCATIYYLLLRLVNSAKWIFCITIVLALLGFILGTMNFPNPWYFIQSLIYLPLLSIGTYLKRNDIHVRYCIPVFVSLLIIVYAIHILGFKVPYVSYALNYTLYSAIPLLIISIIGSVSFLGICKWINENSLLEFIGKNSLIVYAAHICIIRILFTCFVKVFSHRGGQNCISPLVNSEITIQIGGCYLVVFCLTILACCALSKIFNLPYVKILSGKF